MSLFKEFKEFAMKGNAIDLAVGVVIGGAFQSIVNSLVNDIIMPLTAIFTGKIDYSSWKIILADGAIEIGIGSFLNAIINFLIIAFSIFLALKYINKINKKLEELNKEAINNFNKTNKKGKKIKRLMEEEKEEPKTKVCPYCLSEIPYKATRCAHCTAELPKEEKKKIKLDIEVKEEKQAEGVQSDG